MTKRSRQPIDGHRLFYHYLQKDLLESDVWLFQMLTSRLVTDLGIWFHPDVYKRLPIALPYAVRDPGSRGNKAQGIPDQWGSPNSEGFLRDDNSLVKELQGSLDVFGRNRLYEGRRLGNGFVASHLWRVLKSGEYAARDPLTYSFIPNLVWLPSEVAALTDREASFVQSFTQAMSMKIYRHIPLDTAIAPIAEEAWDRLPMRNAIPEQGLPAVDSLNFFKPPDTWIEKKLANIRKYANALDAHSKGDPVSLTGLSKRYAAGLSTVPPTAVKALRDRLIALDPLAP